MPALTSIAAAVSALPAAIDVGKDIFGGGDQNKVGSTGYSNLDPQAQKFNQYLMNYIQNKLSQPHMFRPVPQMPYNIMNMVSQAYGMGPYTDPGWQMTGGGSMPGMPGPSGPPRQQISRRQLAAPGMSRTGSRRRMAA